MKNKLFLLVLAGLLTFTPLTAHASENHLTKNGGVYYNQISDGTTIKETWYDLNMNTVVANMRTLGYDEETYPYYVDEVTGCKMLGDYIIVAANLNTYPRGSVVETSLGDGLVCDTGYLGSSHYDLACDWY